MTRIYVLIDSTDGDVGVRIVDARSRGHLAGEIVAGFDRRLIADMYEAAFDVNPVAIAITDEQIRTLAADCHVALFGSGSARTEARARCACVIAVTQPPAARSDGGAP